MAYSYSFKTNDQASELFKTTFQAPLPMSGSAISRLGDVPTCQDITSFRGSNREVAITTWNTQCHNYPTHVGYTRAAAAVAVARQRGEPALSFLVDGALHQVVAKIRSINAVTRRRLLKGQNMYLTTQAAVYERLPTTRYQARSAVLTDAAATAIAAAYDEGRLVNQPPLDLAGDSDTGEVRELHTQGQDRRQQEAGPSTSPVHADPGPRELRLAAETPPAKRNSALVVPVREVRTVAMTLKGHNVRSPNKSPALVALESYATSGDRAATQPYLSTTRGVLARDMSSIQELAAYVSTYNASYVDTAPALRGLLYCYPRSRDVWSFDSYDARFIRRQTPGTRVLDQPFIFQTPAPERIQIRLAAVTLPAFASHLKNLDSGMAAEGVNGIALSGMDTDWTAVPISSDMLGNPWILELIMCFTTTAIWAGKLNFLSHATHATDALPANVLVSGMPAAHQIHIPGPLKIVLVLVDENTYAQASTITIDGIGAVPVYRGVRIAPGQTPFAQAWIQVQEAMYNRITIANYFASCQNMVKALQYMERNFCHSMAFQFAVTLAAELSSYIPESPKLHGDEQGRYEDELGGGWTLGAHNFSARHPYHTSSNADEGTEAEVCGRLRRLMHGFNFASTSPMQQHAQNYATLAAVDVVLNNNYIGTETHWQHGVPDLHSPQYQCHTANSVYRIITGMGLILKDDFSYKFRNSNGVSNVITMQGVALTLSLGIALAKSDVSRRSWSGIGINNDPFAQTPMHQWVADMTHGVILPANVDTFMRRIINGNQTIRGEILLYHGTQPGDEMWGSHVCAPYPSFLQWAAQFNVDMKGDYQHADGVIVAAVETPHLSIDESNSHSVSWVGSVQDTFAYLPVSFLGYCNAVPFTIPLSIEDWQIMSCSTELVHPAEAGMMSNLCTVSINNRYRNVSRPGRAMVINKFAMRRDQQTWNVSPLQYPDPPSSGFLLPPAPASSQAQNSQGGGLAVLPTPVVTVPPPQEEPQVPTPVTGPK